MVVVSGAGAYADRWHRFDETSARVADVVRGLGHRVAVTGDVEGRLAAPGGCRLLVVNIGNPARPRPAGAVAAVEAGLDSYLGGGGSLLALHASATSMPALPGWERILGGRWVRGRTMHPPRGAARILRSGAEHPITRGLGDFEVLDERYTDLATRADTTVLYEHEHEGHRHPLVWARQPGPGRVVYDALGHDTASYASAGRVALLEASVRWLLAGDPPPRVGPAVSG